MHHLEWVWFEPIYSWGRKLAVIDFLVITGLPLLWIRLALHVTVMLKNLNFCTSGMLLSWIRLAAFLQWLFSKIIVLPQIFIKLYYSPKSHKTLQKSPIIEFLNNACHFQNFLKLWYDLHYEPFEISLFSKITSNTCWF